MKTDSTLRKPVSTWVVRVGDALYVRSVNGSMAMVLGRVFAEGRKAIKALIKF